MLNRVTSHELTEWMSFSTLEPFGAQADYLGHAITATIIANVNRTKGQKPYKVEDFMPKFEKETQTPDQMIRFAQTLTVGLGGQDLRESNDG